MFIFIEENTKEFTRNGGGGNVILKSKQSYEIPIKDIRINE